MKATRLHAFGDVDQFRYEEAPTPQPGEGEVLLKVEASSLNPVDLYLRQGFLQQMMPMFLPAILGGGSRCRSLWFRGGRPRDPEGANADGRITIANILGHEDSPTLQAVADAASTGELSIPIAKTFRLDQVPEAYQALARGHVGGKIVIQP